MLINSAKRRKDSTNTKALPQYWHENLRLGIDHILNQPSGPGKNNSKPSEKQRWFEDVK